MGVRAFAQALIIRLEPVAFKAWVFDHTYGFSFDRVSLLCIISKFAKTVSRLF